jgi:hypothetical protein
VSNFSLFILFFVALLTYLYITVFIDNEGGACPEEMFYTDVDSNVRFRVTRFLLQPDAWCHRLSLSFILTKPQVSTFSSSLAAGVPHLLAGHSRCF